MREDTRFYKGSEWVTVKEFARRTERTPQTVNKYIREGKLAASDVFHCGTIYLKWETQKLRYEEILRKNRKKTNIKYRKNPYQKVSEKGLSAYNGVKPLEAEELDEVSPQEIKPDNNILNIGDVNPYLYPSCWIRDEDDNVIKNPITGKPELDTEKTKDVLQIMLSQQKKDKEDGKLIPKTDIEPTISYIARKFSQYVSSIHSRFGSIYAAEVEKLLGRSLTASEQTRFLNVLKKDEAKFLTDIQAEFRRFSDEYSEQD